MVMRGVLRKGDRVRVIEGGGQVALSGVVTRANSSTRVWVKLDGDNYDIAFPCTSLSIERRHEEIPRPGDIYADMAKRERDPEASWTVILIRPRTLRVHEDEVSGWEAVFGRGREGGRLTNVSDSLLGTVLTIYARDGKRIHTPGEAR